MFPAMQRTFRKLAFITFVLAILIHEPSFKAGISILVNLHIMLRIAFDILRYNSATYFPAFGGWAAAACYGMRDFIFAQIGHVISALAPLIQQSAITVLSAATKWLRESPRYLCELNEWLVKAGEGMALRVVKEDAGELVEQWFLSGEDVARFCGLVRG